MQLHVDRLLKDELIFEINSRGGHADDTITCKDLCKILRELLMLEKEGKSFKVNLSVVPTDELNLLDKKLNDISSLLKSEITTNSLKKIETKLCHCLNRLEKIECVDKNHAEQKSKLLTNALNFVSDFKQKENKFKNKATLTDLIFQGTSQVTSTPIRNSNNSSLDNGSPLDTANVDMERLIASINIREMSEISRWNLKFDGQSDLSINAFFERISELCEAGQISKNQLFKGAVEFFEGKALIFYRAIKDRVNDWDSLCVLFREEFLPHDYNEKLWGQIKKRTQGEKESIGIYLAVMNNLFKRLITPVDESIKLKIIRKNILPFYQSQLTLTDINTQDQLLELCRKLDEVKDSVSNFIPPNTDKSLLEPDLSYHSKYSKKQLDNLQVDKPQVKFDAQRDSSVDSLRDKNFDKNRGFENHSRNRSISSQKNSNISNQRSNSSDNKSYDNGGNHRSRKDNFYNSQSRQRNFSNDRYFDNQYGENSANRPYNRDYSFNRNQNVRTFNSQKGVNRNFSSDRNRSYNRNFSSDRNYSNDRNFSRERNFSGSTYYRDNSRNRSFSRDKNFSRNKNFNRNRDFSGNRTVHFYNTSRGNHSNNFVNRNSYNNQDQHDTICYNCGEKNHIAKHCRKKGKN